MKRQAKPFAVEIKRSRRSVPQHETFGPDLLQNNAVLPEPDKPARLFLKDLATSASQECSDLIIPVFLQGLKDIPLQQAKNETPANSENSSFWKPGKAPGDASSAPRILPCLSPALEEKTVKLYSAAKPRVHSKSSTFEGLTQPQDPASSKAGSVILEESIEQCNLESNSRPGQTGELSSDATFSHLKRRVHRFLKVDREKAASLPPGQRWKRRLLSRAR